MKSLIFCMLLCASVAHAQQLCSTVSAYPYSESFENGLGSWTQNSNDDFNWSRHSGPTNSTGTGPSAAFDGQYYMYTEASGNNHPSKTAIFTSPCFDLTTVSDPQLEFSYHMTGAGMGSLTLQISLNNGTSWNTLWSKTGQQGTWKSVAVGLNNFTNNTIMIRFVGTTGSSFQSDIAIDLVKIYSITINPTPCNTNFPTTSDFETGFSGWTQNTNDDFDWVRRSGSTPSNNTGPNAAAEGKYYIYTEASFENHPSKTAILTSRCQDLTSMTNPFAKFQYHMYGAAMGSLKFQVSVNNGPWWTLWTKTGNQGNQGANGQNGWWNVQIGLANFRSNNTRIRFVGTTGNSFTSDIAIDDFIIEEGVVFKNKEANTDQLTTLPTDTYLQIAPNPFNDWVNIETNIQGIRNYRILNLQGQVIKEANLQGNQIELSELSAGVYFITLYNEKEQIVRKIVKR